MSLVMHARYAELIDKAYASHHNFRDPSGIDATDVTAARLYSHAFRRHVIGAFDATCKSLMSLPPTGPLAIAHRGRAIEALEDLANLAMEAVPRDFRAIVVTLYRYHRGILRVLAALEAEQAESPQAAVARIAEIFQRSIERTTTSNGIELTQDTGALEQESFIVPNLGITIVPLVYGDHHSWNLAFLPGPMRDVPFHSHRRGAEIHLGFEPTLGQTVLGDFRAAVREGYAMPIPPGTTHGWIHEGNAVHHVPFVFGSFEHGGWGVFLDVQPQSVAREQLRSTPRDHSQFEHLIYLERAIDTAAPLKRSNRNVLIPAAVTNRAGGGGLEFAVTRVTDEGFTYPLNEFRAVSVVRGQGVVSIEGIEQLVVSHDHFGVPADMQATMLQTSSEPLVILDCVLRDA